MWISITPLSRGHPAIEFYERALSIVREIGDRNNERFILENLGTAYKNVGEASLVIDLDEREPDRRVDVFQPYNQYLEGQAKEESDTSQIASDYTPASVKSPAGPRVVTWLHPSDIHFCNSELHEYSSNIIIKSLRKDIRERIQKEDLQSNFIVFTGGLANSGKPRYHL